MKTNPKRPSPNDLHVGAGIRSLREARQLTQADLAQKLGITTQQVQKYESGTNRVSASRLYDIAQVFEVRVSYFFRALIEPMDGV
jgi:transcriptional regulator with XRE-family HTH domain